MPPDCNDPVYQEERRQAEWDAKCARAPRCTKCDGSVYPYETYAEWDGIVLCEKCVNRILDRFEDFFIRHTHFTDELEVD